MSLRYEIGIEGYGVILVEDEGSVNKLFQGLVDTSHVVTHFIKIYDTDQIQWSLNPRYIQYIALVKTTT